MEITPLTQDLIIVKASGSELKIMGTAVIYMEAEVLRPDKKQLEVAVIQGQEDTKENLVSLKLMKMWDVVHDSFLKESLSSNMFRITETNKLDKNYVSYYSIQVNEKVIKKV